MNSSSIPKPPPRYSGVKKSYPQNSEEAERLAVYEAWPKIPPKIRRAILLMIDATTDEELENDDLRPSGQPESISRPSTPTDGNQ